MWGAPLVFKVGHPSLTRRHSLPGAAGGMLLPRAESWCFHTFDHPHHLHPENTPESKWGWHHTSPNIPAQSGTSPCCFFRNTRKAPPIKRFLWSFKQPELRRTELFNSLNMVQSKFIDNYSANILSCPCGQNHLSKPLISNLRFLLFCYQIPPRKLPRSILKQLRFLLPALCLMEGF